MILNSKLDFITYGNRRGYEYNFGIMRGYDITLTYLSEAPVTTLGSKDRSTPHDPTTVLFSYHDKEFFSKDFKEMKKMEFETRKK